MIIRTSSAVLMFKQAAKTLERMPEDTFINAEMDFGCFCSAASMRDGLSLDAIHIREGILKLEKTLDRDKEYLDAIKPNNSDPLPEP